MAAVVAVPNTSNGLLTNFDWIKTHDNTSGKRSEQIDGNNNIAKKNGDDKKDASENQQPCYKDIGGNPKSNGNQKSNGEKANNSKGWVPVPPEQLWVGPSTITSIRVARLSTFDSLLKESYKELTGFKKIPQREPVKLVHLGFEGDEREYPPHHGPDHAVLQYNPNRYAQWKEYLEEIKVEKNERRDALLDHGGFGENIVVEENPDTPPMDETTMCIGDLVSIQRGDGVECCQIRVTGQRNPCYKLNHRFGIPSMSQKTQNKGWTGWLYSVEKEGDLAAGDKMVLLERPWPEWPVSRVQHYCFKETKNMDVMREALDTFGDRVTREVIKMFTDRLEKGVEDMSLRLTGDTEDLGWEEYRLGEKTRETERVSEFIFERVKKLSADSKDLRVASSGSHARLRLRVGPNDMTVIRPYSIISGDTNRFVLGIALADESRGGSAYIHNMLKVGETVEVAKDWPNTFPLHSEDANNHVFLAGGIGITAFLDHIRHCLETKKRFHLHYMMRNKSDYAFKKLIEKMLVDADDTQRMTVYTSADGNRCDLKKLLAGVAKDEKTHIYVCGSEAMAKDAKEKARELGIADKRFQQEQFTVDNSGDPFVAEVSNTKVKVQVGSRQSLMGALRDAGIEVASSCEAGNCGTCRIKVKCGKIVHRGNGLMEEELSGYQGKEEGEMLSCVSRAVGTITIEI